MRIKTLLLLTLATSVLFPQISMAVTRVLFLGDSLTAGYNIEQTKAFPALLQAMSQKEGLDFEMINAGMSGDTSAGALRRLPWLLKKKINICIIALGANDGLRGLPVAELKANLLTIIAKLRDANPEIKIAVAGMKLPANFGDSYRDYFKEIYSEVSKDSNVKLIPFLLEGVAGDPQLNLEDRLHPSEEGHKVIAASIWPILKSL